MKNIVMITIMLGISAYNAYAMRKDSVFKDITSSHVNRFRKKKPSKISCKVALAARKDESLLCKIAQVSCGGDMGAALKLLQPRSPRIKRIPRGRKNANEITRSIIRIPLIGNK